MKNFILLVTIFCLVSFTGTSTTPPVEQISKYTFSPTNILKVTTDFAGSILLDAEQLAALEGKKIHHIDLVYTQYKESPNFNQQALNDRRTKTLIQQLPQIKSDHPTWKLVEQTGAKTRDEAADYFHGFVIHYSDDLDYESLNNFLSSYQKEFTVYHVNNANGGVLSYESGSKITLPAQAVRYSDGSLVEGTYELRYREFRNQAEIALSGIPMTYEQKGELMNFNSAGMYEIRAAKDGQELVLDRAATVDFNCTEQLNGTDFYALDDATGVWEKQAPVIFREGNEVQNGVEFGIDQQVNAIEPAIKWSSVTISNDNQKKSEKFEWSLTDRDDKTTVTFNKLAWNRLETSLKKDTVGVHLIENKNPEERTITAASEDRDALVAAVNRWQEIFEMPVAVLPNRNGNFPNETGSTLLAEGINAGHTYPNLVKGLNSPSFGVYNCDQVYRLSNIAVITPKYVDASSGKEITATKVACLIDLDYNGSFSFQPNNITCNPDGRNAVVLFTKDNKVFLLSEMRFKAGVATNKSRPVFEMTDMTASLKSPDDLKKVLHL